jgi:hypothetical protein
MANGKGRRFLQGLGAGAGGSLVGGAALLYLLDRQALVSFSNGLLQDTGGWLDWAYANLGLSIPVFALLLAAYVVTLARLRRCLDGEQPIERLIQLDHLTETWIALFFGTGVIWTAIGMRSALIGALGDPGASVEAGAFTVLRRLVDGGILLALSTTIFGGVGGYLMRVYKSVTLGSRLQERYNAAARVDTASIRDVLHRIERQLRTVGRRGQGDAS